MSTPGATSRGGRWPPSRGRRRGLRRTRSRGRGPRPCRAAPRAPPPHPRRRAVARRSAWGSARWTRSPRAVRREAIAAPARRRRAPAPDVHHRRRTGPRECTRAGERLGERGDLGGDAVRQAVDVARHDRGGHPQPLGEGAREEHDVAGTGWAPQPGTSRIARREPSWRPPPLAGAVRDITRPTASTSPTTSWPSGAGSGPERGVGAGPHHLGVGRAGQGDGDLQHRSRPVPARGPEPHRGADRRGRAGSGRAPRRTLHRPRRVACRVHHATEPSHALSRAPVRHGRGLSREPRLRRHGPPRARGDGRHRGPHRGDAPFAARRGQAHPAGAGPGHLRGARPARRAAAARRRGDRAGPHLLADPRRPAGDGRRRPAPRAADLPQAVR